VEEAHAAVPKPDYDALINETLDYVDSLHESGQLIAAESLEKVQTATTLRVRHGKLSVTDGPFAETKEQLGGFFLIDARDLNDAIRIASKLPPARIGSIEVRPVEDLTQRR
jgi:hypothetical protein